MAMVACQECSGQVSSTASACPHCGAPFKKFMPKPKGFWDHFSEDRIRAKQAESDANLKSSLAGCLSMIVLFGLLVLLVMMIF